MCKQSIFIDYVAMSMSSFGNIIYIHIVMHYIYIYIYIYYFNNLVRKRNIATVVVCSMRDKLVTDVGFIIFTS